MTDIPPFPSGTLPARRHDGTETRIWLGTATVQHAERQRKSWRAALAEDDAMDAAWDWRAEVDAMHRDPSRLVLAVCQRDKGGRVHALMNVLVLPHGSRLEPPADLLYIDMLAVAPWNRAGHRGREIKGLGPLLIHAAILVSRAAGLGGAFGLHSLPDPATLRFYHDVMGVAPIAMEQTPEGKLVYFEARPDEAVALLDQEARVP